jgi:hypothetical protein
MAEKTSPMCVELGHDAIVIRCHGLIHVHIRMSDYIGFQSWMNGDKNYAVEFTLRGGDLLCEYDSRDKWEAVLRGLEKILLLEKKSEI